MASTILFTAVIATFLFLAAEGKYEKSASFVGNPNWIDNAHTKIGAVFKFDGEFIAGTQGKWEMYAYGSDTNVSDQEDLIEGSPQLLNEDDQNKGDDVHFVSKQAVFTGLKGCSGDRKNFGCFILYRGGVKKISMCMRFQPSCPVLE
ncbi:uncharacterized protein [Asterias amurensis]|uniref:uncharacterized protein n=1 Tax=Asterias amurensis TaxID=7602 RepID=UPI003AB47C87